MRTVRLPPDSDEMLFQGNRTEGRIEVKQAYLPLNAEEVGNIDVVWKRSAETHDSNDGLTGFDLYRVTRYHKLIGIVEILTCRRVRATMVSITAPRSSLSR